METYSNYKISDYLCLGQSTGRGVGVFSIGNTVAGTILAITASWELTPIDLIYYDQTSVGGHYFDHPDKVGHGLLPLGPAALVNHSLTPNCSLIWQKTSLGYIGNLVASKDLEPMTEIFIDYGIGFPECWV